MSGSQHKKEEKARRKAEREKLRQEEKRRNQMTAIIVGVIVLLGGVMVALSIEREPSLEELEEVAASEAEELRPEDEEAAAGEPVDSGEEGQVDDRPVACEGTEPDNAADSRPRFPGGPAEVLEEGVDYQAVITTTCGEITLDLKEDEAPETVNSFVFLAQQGFYEGLEIFRNATSIGALQTGSGNQTASWSIGYNLPDELSLAEADGYPAGSVAMANTGAPGSGGSQFFFVYNDLFDSAFAGNRTYAVFADITDGLDVIERIGAIETDGEGSETPSERVYMESVEIIEAG